MPTCREEFLKLLPNQTLGARQVAPLGHRQRKLQVVELLANKGHNGGIVHCAQNDLATPAERTRYIRHKVQPVYHTKVQLFNRH